MLKIDQVSNLGAARIRIRSLMAALKEQQEQLEEKHAAEGEARRRSSPWACAWPTARSSAPAKTDLSRVARPSTASAKSAALHRRRDYTKEMQDARYTILAPQMSARPLRAGRSSSFSDVWLQPGASRPAVDQGAVDAGLKYVNNDICYPSILVGGPDHGGRPSRAASTTSRTRPSSSRRPAAAADATNYIALIRKALRESWSTT